MKVGLLLAAGLSQRFSGQNKLLAPFRGAPLITHAARVMSHLGLDTLFAVIADPDTAQYLDGFEVIHHPNPERGQGTSLALGAQAARERGAQRFLIMLADMPFVTVEHGLEVLRRCTDDTPSASVSEGRVMPPACFPASSFADLSTREGDRGARDLLKGLPPSSLVQGSAHDLFDIDTPEDLSRIDV